MVGVEVIVILYVPPPVDVTLNVMGVVNEAGITAGDPLIVSIDSVDVSARLK